MQLLSKVGRKHLLNFSFHPRNNFIRNILKNYYSYEQQLPINDYLLDMTFFYSLMKKKLGQG